MLTGCSSNATAAEQQVAFEKWKKDFKGQAVRSGLPRSYVNDKMDAAELLPGVIASDKKQSEFVSTFWTYTDGAVSQSRVKRGREMREKYRELAEQNAVKYGVPAKYLIAFWGIETNYGSYKGNIDTVNALSTLAFDKRRRTFFTNELITFLHISKENEWDTVKGSWAGAFGNFQFMPTTFKAYAVDGDGDGKQDVVNSLPDAFASAANYLSQMGWVADEPWGMEVRLTKPLNWDDVYDKHTVLEWEKMGVKPYQKTAPNLLNMPSRLVLPMGVGGPAFLTFKNYDITMQWNRSMLYALAVGLLADSIEDDQFKINQKRTDETLTRSDIKEMQSILKKNGYYQGGIDGSVGPQTRRAIRAVQKKFGLPQDSYPTNELLNKLRGL